MDHPQHGESSRSPHQRAALLANDSIPNGRLVENQQSAVEDGMSRLILGNWDAPPPKHIHASHDLISLLHLDSLYNTYVRPFADAIGPEDDAMKDEGGDGDGMQVDGEGPGGAGKKRKRGKRAKLEKGYTHLIDDCIDPTPLGEHKDNLAILPLIPDQLDPSHEHPVPEQGPRPTMLEALWNNARLEAGQKVDGYDEGVKKGVKENEEKRQRKRLQRQAQSSSGVIVPGLPSPALVAPYDRAPGTPSLPIAPPRPPFNLSTSARKPFVPSRPPGPGTPGGRFVPGTPGIRPPGTPGTPRVRLGSGSGPTLIPAPGSASTPNGLPPRPSSAFGNKRPGEALPGLNPKRTKPVGGSRSASPMPHVYTPQPQSAGSHPVGRPGVGKQPRSRTEGA
ncbi:hypothetical protein DB88DRAFT_479851 [Papiliotrema laurentii]|uniref:Mediator of RNA polymerase II transcription subunit 19 n=1 Tax=Papiliotrema laurentii TaxID=5418 RepID=A0AAD9FXN1_PAPLA|nr:hypothetical protein DB88DRAFT_479851 [Papiliotrema laurentii]